MSSRAPVLIAPPVDTTTMDPNRVLPAAEALGKRKRKEVAVFVKVLLDYLHKNEPGLKEQMKMVSC